MTTTSPKPAKHFAKPPYKAECLDGPKGVAGWWGVMNADGFNCLTFVKTSGESIGQVVTCRDNAIRIADEWNYQQSHKSAY